MNDREFTCFMMGAIIGMAVTVIVGAIALALFHG